MTTQTYGAHVPRTARTIEAVLVVGTGPDRLTAAQLSGLRLPAEILERSNKVASAWRRRHDWLRLNTGGNRRCRVSVSRGGLRCSGSPSREWARTRMLYSETLRDRRSSTIELEPMD